MDIKGYDNLSRIIIDIKNGKGLAKKFYHNDKFL
jgi:hypothetical protein